MPRNELINKILLISSGADQFGQSAECGRAFLPACQAFYEENVEVILAGSFPMRIAADFPAIKHVYAEALNVAVLQRIIEEERPDGVFPAFGEQADLVLIHEIAETGFLDENDIPLLGLSQWTLEHMTDRRKFVGTMRHIHHPCLASKEIESPDDALEFAGQLGYPVLFRPIGAPAEAAGNAAELRDLAARFAGRRASVERCVNGWKDITFDMMRDCFGNVVAVCASESVEPIGPHAQYSAAVIPAMTLADREYQMLRTAASEIITEMDIHGYCRIRFALDPHSSEYAVLSASPLISRPAAHAAKATGYPIAYTAAKLALGYALDEIPFIADSATCAAYEPALDRIAVSVCQPTASGALVFSDTFEGALQKAVRSAALAPDTLRRQGKRLGFSDAAIERIVGVKPADAVSSAYREIDSCTTGSAARTKYFYAASSSSFDTGDANPVLAFLEPVGQNIEFDCASVRLMQSLKEAGYGVVLIGNDPEMHCADFGVADRVYFEPLCSGDVLRVIAAEKPAGVLVFSGRSADCLIEMLQNDGVPVVGSPVDSMGIANDHERFAALILQLNALRRTGGQA